MIQGLKEYVEQAGKINIEKAGKSGLNNRLYQPFNAISKEDGKIDP